MDSKIRNSDTVICRAFLIKGCSVIHHGFTSILLASCVALSLLLSGCATKQSPTSPLASTNKQQYLSILNSTLSLANQQKYTQIAESGSSSVSQAYLGHALPSHIQQAVQVDGIRAKIEQDSSPNIYELTNDLFYVSAGRWSSYSVPQFSIKSSGWISW